MGRSVYIAIAVALVIVAAVRFAAKKRRRGGDHYSVADGLLGVPAALLSQRPACPRDKNAPADGLQRVRGAWNTCKGGICTPVAKMRLPHDPICDTAPRNDGWFTMHSSGAVCTPTSAYHRGTFVEDFKNVFPLSESFETESWDVRENFGAGFTPNPHGPPSGASRLLGIPTRITDDL